MKEAAEEREAADAERQLNELANRLSAKNIRVRRLITHGPVADEIVAVAKNEGVDLVVIATHGATGWSRLVFGSVAEKVVRLAECPVLTVRAPVGKAAFGSDLSLPTF